MKIPLMDITASYPEVREQIISKVNELIDSSNFIGGKEVDTFEKEFAAYNGIDFCTACSNGTDAIIISLHALGIGRGDTVLVPANTFIATAEAVTAVGAEVSFIDVEDCYYTIDPNEVEAFIKRNPKKNVRAVIPVHLYGQMADMRSLRYLADKYSFFLVEDSAQAHGALLEGKGPGLWGDIATYSFYPGKNLGAFGDAGGIVTKNQEFAKKCKMLINHGRAEGDKYIHAIEGFNSRMDAIQAAILRIKLRYLEEWNQKRREIAAIYNKKLRDNVKIPEIRESVLPVWYVYTIQVNNRDDFIEKLALHNISTGIYYPVILPLQPAYRKKQCDQYPIATKHAERILSLPMYPELSKEAVDYICSIIEEI